MIVVAGQKHVLYIPTNK